MVLSTVFTAMAAVASAWAAWQAQSQAETSRLALNAASTNESFVNYFDKLNTLCRNVDQLFYNIPNLNSPAPLDVEHSSPVFEAINSSSFMEQDWSENLGIINQISEDYKKLDESLDMLSIFLSDEQSSTLISQKMYIQTRVFEIDGIRHDYRMSEMLENIKRIGHEEAKPTILSREAATELITSTVKLRGRCDGLQRTVARWFRNRYDDDQMPEFNEVVVSVRQEK